VITSPIADPAGDDLIAGAEPHAAALICAVRDRDRDDIAEVLGPLDRRQLYALAVLLAAAYPDTRSLPELLAERDAVDEAALREAHSAYNRGVRTPYAVEGERAYKRRAKRDARVRAARKEAAT